MKLVNVDKIIQQLKKEQEKLNTDIFSQENDDWYGQYCNGISEGIEKAIDIIKNEVTEQNN